MNNGNNKEMGYGNKLLFGSRPALLISDMQKAYTDPQYPRGMSAERQIQSINQLISACRLEKIPIFFSVISFSPEHLNTKNIWLLKIPGLKDLKEGSEFVKIDPRLDYQATDTVIKKQYPSAFFATPFLNKLREKNIDTLIITGCTTSGCVRATAVDAMQYGFKPIIPKEAVIDRWESASQQALFDLNAKYADVVDMLSCINYIEKSNHQ